MPAVTPAYSPATRQPQVYRQTPTHNESRWLRQHRSVCNDGVLGALLLFALLAWSTPANAQSSESNTQEDSTRAMPPMTVTPNLAAVAPSLAEIDRQTLARLRPVHASELRLGAPGLWISRGSGQEHLTAIRSPVLTGAGACGAFAFVDNGIPVRPAGLCNVNQLIELNIEQADVVRLQRGPQPLTLAHGALHGAIETTSDANSTRTLDTLFGPDDFVRLGLDADTQMGDTRARVRALLAHDGGFRAESGYEMGKLGIDTQSAWGEATVDTHITATLLHQETAGFVRGQDAFEVPAIALSNPNPEAFRDAWSLRASTVIETPRLRVQPFFRRSQMTFLQHFLPGQPLERNQQTSAGVAASREWAAGQTAFNASMLLDLADMRLSETQANVVQSDSAFLRATRPPGDHYDFRVRGASAVLAFLMSRPLGDRHRIRAGLRVDSHHLRYSTDLTPGNNDDQGNACGFGGCLFSRPADRSDTFFELAPSLSFETQFSAQTRTFVTLARGVRAPQITELYRLQSGQTVAELEPETLDSLDVGVRHRRGALNVAATVFAGLKRNGILRDADGFNVNQSRTLHSGLEFDAGYRVNSRLRLSASGTLAGHRYRFDRLSPGSEPIRRNDDVDTAPRSLGSIAATLTPTAASSVHIEWEHLGGYYLDAANEHRYGGHNLIHAMLDYRFARGSVGVRIRNVMDRAYAERADFAFGQYRYFAGQPRSVFVSLRINL